MDKENQTCAHEVRSQSLCADSRTKGKNSKNTSSKPPFSPTKTATVENFKSLQNLETNQTTPLFGKCATNFFSVSPEALQPSPSKKRVSSNSGSILNLNFVVDEKPACHEIKLFGGGDSSKKNSETSTIIKISTKKGGPVTETSKKIGKKYSKKTTNSKQLARNSSQNLRNPTSPNFKANSYLSPNKKSPLMSSFYTPDTQKSNLRVFTPVLTEKKRKMPENSQFCKRISLFDQNKSFSLNSNHQQSFISLKEQSTRTEDSNLTCEITPIKQEMNKSEFFPDESFSSPLQTIKILNSPEQNQVYTPEPNVKMIVTPEAKNNNAEGSEKKQKIKKNKNARKGIIDFSTPDSHFFSLSSSSEQEIASEISFSEEGNFSEGFVVNGKKVIKNDKEMQTDETFVEIISLLNNQEIMSGLKMIGKFKELLKLIN